MLSPIQRTQKTNAEIQVKLLNVPKVHMRAQNAEQ